MRRDVQQIIDQAEELADYFESGFSSNDPEDIATLRAAVHRRAVAESDIAQAVTAAVSAGRSWRAIGEALGTTGEAARQRYGKLVGAGTPTGAQQGTPAAKRARANKAAATAAKNRKYTTEQFRSRRVRTATKAAAKAEAQAEQQTGASARFTR